MEQLTTKQEQIFHFIKDVLNAKGYPPSVREICLAVGLKSTSTVHSHLNKLEEKGFIRRDPTKPRAIEILDGTREWLQDHVKPIPIIGTVTAGAPILATENIEGYYPMPQAMSHHGEAYMLRVQGESMINAGIFHRDYIIVRQQDSANNGDIVVALLGDEVTVKRFYKEKNRIRLQPENDTMDPIYCLEVKILGKVVGLFREMN
ncbi:MAG: transcriptional repressor LexA [Cellulosilyticaceae bacterium]